MIATVRAGLSRLGGRLTSGFTVVRDSPLAELDLRELLASWRTGLILGLLTLAVGITALVAGASSSEAPFRALVAKLGMGRLLVAGAQLAIGAALTLFVPIRAAGVVEGPRWRGFFDQLVTSGLRPRDYYLGRALAVQGLIALVFVGTAPLVLALALTDPPPLRPILEGHLLLLVYAEVLLAATLGTGVLVHESLAAIGTILVAAGLGVAAFFQVPSALAALSPARAIVGPLAAIANTELTPAESDVLYGPVHFFSLEVPLVPFAVALSLLVGAVALSPCFVGRPYAFAPGVNNFGAIVLGGDRRRASILRFRPALVRRGELAFFFENHGPAHAWLAPWARLVRATALFGLVTVLPLGALWNEALLGVVTPREHAGYGLAIVGGVFGAFAVLAPALLASSKLDARLDLAFGRRARIPLPLADVFLYALLAGALLTLFDRTTDDLVASGAFVFKPSFGGPAFKSMADVVEGLQTIARILCVVGLALLLLQKISGLRLNDPVSGVAIAWFLVGATFFLPAAVDPTDLKVSEARARDPDQETPERSPEENAASLVALHLCPAFQVKLVFDPDCLEDVPLPPGQLWVALAHDGFWVIYPTFELLLFFAAVEIVRQRRREAAAELEGPLVPAEPPGKTGEARA